MWGKSDLSLILIVEAQVYEKFIDDLNNLRDHDFSLETVDELLEALQYYVIKAEADFDIQHIEMASIVYTALCERERTLPPKDTTHLIGKADDILPTFWVFWMKALDEWQSSSGVMNGNPH